MFMYRYKNISYVYRCLIVFIDVFILIYLDINILLTFLLFLIIYIVLKYIGINIFLYIDMHGAVFKLLTNEDGFSMNF